MTAVPPPNSNIQPTGPYNSMREFIAALDARGKLLRIANMDQDRYEATAFAYRMLDKRGREGTPAFLIECTKIDGAYREGAVVGNLYNGWDAEAMVFGVKDIVDDPEVMYARVMDKVLARLDDGGQWQRIIPTTVEPSHSPCKEVVVQGDDIDVLNFPWFKNNPADAGRYINTGAVFIQDPKIGRNVGTYRCQVKSKTKIGMNANPGQHGGRLLRMMKARGEKTAKIAIALGVDPIIWSVSTSKLSGFGEDEIEVAGGLRGAPVQLVKCETSDILVPAEAEMIIEGEVPLTEAEDEGPYAEMYGYMGPLKHNNFFMNIKTITHRHMPIFFNSYTGITADMIRVPLLAGYYWTFKKQIPNLKAINLYAAASGIHIAAIDKRFAGEGMQAGQVIAANPTVKVAIIVDSDINILSPHEVFHAMAARWQPSASVMFPQAHLQMPDPSRIVRGLSSKMVIDATRQFANEGGHESWPSLSRTVFEESCGDAFDLVDEKWEEYWEGLSGGRS